VRSRVVVVLLPAPEHGSVIQLHGQNPFKIILVESDVLIRALR
jgi:hypothetical protein